MEWIDPCLFLLISGTPLLQGELRAPPPQHLARKWNAQQPVPVLPEAEVAETEVPRAKPDLPGSKYRSLTTATCWLRLLWLVLLSLPRLWEIWRPQPPLGRY